MLHLGKLPSHDKRGDTLRSALQRAYAGVGMVRFEGMHYRRDIASRALSRLPAETPSQDHQP